ncbi:hypothetical protein BDN72DRAFT_866456 [Pluteus cervinus]|uniref:Uncharacterized protein n=1 Tax=Pluteus cervinus TaxID=181527 RepID=A0ACD2ZWH7_9AGAR|nr:hypothetical protein BDN72DRAFT_866456 [Pluteus cervinus]
MDEGANFEVQADTMLEQYANIDHLQGISQANSYNRDSNPPAYEHPAVNHHAKLAANQSYSLPSADISLGECYGDGSTFNGYSHSSAKVFQRTAANSYQTGSSHSQHPPMSATNSRQPMIPQKFAQNTFSRSPASSNYQPPVPNSYPPTQNNYSGSPASNNYQSPLPNTYQPAQNNFSGSPTRNNYQQPLRTTSYSQSHVDNTSTQRTVQGSNLNTYQSPIFHQYPQSFGPTQRNQNVYAGPQGFMTATNMSYQANWNTNLPESNVIFLKHSRRSNPNSNADSNHIRN